MRAADAGGRGFAPATEPRLKTAHVDDAVAQHVSHARLDVLKLVAILSMIVDHVNTIAWDTRYPELRAIGRLAFPLFAFVLAYNFTRHTHHPWRLIGRLLVWGAISQLFFTYAFGNNLLNIFFTLGFGLCYTAVFRRGSLGTAGVLLAIALIGVSKLLFPIASRLDYGIEGVLLVFAFARVVEQPSATRAALALLFTAVVNPWHHGHLDVAYGLAAAASLALIAATAESRGEWHWMRRCRLCFYFFYPAHLFVIRALTPG